MEFFQEQFDFANLVANLFDVLEIFGTRLVFLILKTINAKIEAERQE